VAAGGSIDALSQFQLHPALGAIGASVNFTQANLMMVVAGLLTFGLLWLGMRPRAMVPGRLQSAAEMAYETVLGIRLHGWHFFSYFVPQGVPVALLPLLVPIEVLSYLSRLISLSVRLFANMMAGHVMLEVFGAFVVMLGAAGVIFWLPAAFSLAVNVALIGFELLVATLQAYVFAVLTCIYLHDAVHLH
jgi:F0F1-type ATP synthase membrane subunit a